MSKVNEYDLARDETEKALAALFIARRKPSAESVWSWARTAAYHAVNIGVREAGTLLGVGARPDLDALERAVMDKRSDDIIIVTRHPGLVEWLDRRGIIGRVLERATPADCLGKHVVGNIPRQLEAIAATTTRIAIPGCPHERRQDDLTADELEQFGAFLRTYTVRETEALK